MKKPATAEFLTRLNGDLAATHEELLAGLGAPEGPVLAIVAPPRGASTLLQQILLSRFDIGYVSNIAARFWRVPLIGLRLHRETADPGYTSHFRSEYGLTEGAEGTA